MPGGKHPASIKVGPVEIPGRAALAPLAGYTEYPYRAVVAAFGCPYAVTPLISAEGLVRGNVNTRRLLISGKGDVPVVAGQIFGSRPAAMAEAAKVVADAGFPLVDINLGCPVPKVRKQLAGAALPGDPAALLRVVRAVVAASPVPVTAKIRLGRDGEADEPLATAKLLHEEGVAALTVHGRTVEQRFSGPVNVPVLHDIVAALTVPVWVNGGVETVEEAADLLDATGAAGVMVGRAAVRKPYLIGHIEAYLAEGRAPAEPGPAELAEAILDHFDRAETLDGEERVARQFRKHLLAYLKPYPETRALRARASHVESRDDVVAVLEDFVAASTDGT
ncbi:MAG: tRNA-dihydrouridine synthase [Candidatus Zixiibacteriota bacterium]|jgi:tRNA-dihydrouridine synthase B